jgi:hypothetical protein
VVAMRDGGSVAFADIARITGSGLWTVFFVALRKHPEWLSEKF